MSEGRAIIRPTVGRVVWYRPAAPDIHSMSTIDPAQPMKADVVFVHDERTVNLLVTDHRGQQFGRMRVLLVQDGDPVPDGKSYCEWMPYQKGQAAKTEALEKELRR